MKKVLMLVSYKKNKLGDYDDIVNALNEDSDRYGHQVFRGALKELEFQIEDNRPRVYDPVNKMDLSEYDLVFFRMWVKEYERATAAAAYLDYTKTPFFDPEVFNYRAFSKLTEMFLTSTIGMPVPDTYYTNNKKLLNAFESGRVDLGMPFILKSIKGLKGKDNYLVESLSQLKDILANNQDIEFMAQRYIPNDSDYRLWVMGDKVRFIMRRIREVDMATHLNNTSQGARAELVDPETLNPEIISQSVAVAKRMKRVFTGVDVIVDSQTGKHYFLEVNNQPEVLSVFVEEKLTALHEYMSEATK